MKCKDCGNSTIRQPYDEVPDFSFKPYYYCRVKGVEVNPEETSNQCF